MSIWKTAWATRSISSGWEKRLRKAMSEFRPELVMYVAGADRIARISSADCR